MRTASAPIDAKLFRDVMGGFATGVAIVTTKVEDELHGMTVNSFTSVSLDPTLILVCFMKGARTADAVKRRGAFVVNILEQRQEVLSDRFARRGEDHFEGLDVRLNDHDLPILPGGLGHLVCEVEATYPGGDHDIVVARVLHVEARTGVPLIFFRGQYDTLTGDGRDAYWYW